MDDLHDWGTGEAPKPPRSFPPNRRPQWHVQPQTLDDLLQRVGPYANATRTYVEWGAVSTWLMKSGANTAMDAAFLHAEAAHNAVFHTRQAEQQEAGWPHLTGKAPTPVLYDLPADLQCKARSMAAEVRSLWEATGRPYLDSRRVITAYQYFVGCIRNGTIPPVKTIGDVGPRNL